MVHLCFFLQWVQCANMQSVSICVFVYSGCSVQIFSLSVFVYLSTVGAVCKYTVCQYLCICLQWVQCANTRSLSICVPPQQTDLSLADLGSANNPHEQHTPHIKVCYIQLRLFRYLYIYIAYLTGVVWPGLLYKHCCPIYKKILNNL